MSGFDGTNLGPSASAQSAMAARRRVDWNLAAQTPAEPADGRNVRRPEVTEPIPITTKEVIYRPQR